MKNNNLSFTLLCLVIIAGVIAALVAPAGTSHSTAHSVTSIPTVSTGSTE